MNISELRPGMHVLDYADYEFVVADVSEVYQDDFGEDCIQVSTQCGNSVFYNQEHWDEFQQICPIHNLPMDFKGGGCACCVADQESAECHADTE